MIFKVLELLIYIIIFGGGLFITFMTQRNALGERRRLKENLRNLTEAPLAPTAGCVDLNLCFGKYWRRGFKLVSTEPCGHIGTYPLYQVVASWDDRQDRTVSLCDNCLKEADERYPVITPEKLMAKLIKGEV